MSHSHPRRLNGLFGKRAPKERRPAGVSRRAKRQFTFEPLEDRRVMAEGTGGTGGWVDNLQRSYFSTNTIAGTQAIYADEMSWAAMIAGASAAQPRTTFSIPTDPLVANQWHLINVGQEVGSPDWQPIYGVPGNDVNVAPVWMMNNGQGYTGAGVTVAVIDSGVQTNHPDLAANISTTIPGYNVAGSGSNANPTPNQPGGPHGTAVAGIIAAVANNGIGGTGIAPGASIVPIRFLAPTLNANATVDAFRYRIQDIDITNNSWGSAAERTLSPLSTAEVNALRDSIIFGRGGLGVIHVFASGNSAGSSLTPGFGGTTGNDSSIYDGFQNSRYTITVGGYDHDGEYLNEDGTIMGYPEAGPNVLIVAPTGSNANVQIADDQGIGSGIYTTDLTGTVTNGLGGYNVPPHPTQGEIYDRDFLPDGNYTSRFNGTSAAAPMVTGVIALMLEANPNLSWRDVQEILLRSARQVSPLEEPTTGSGGATQNTWFVNQQGLFQNPDDFDPESDVPVSVMVGNPIWDPALNQPLKMTNGAGYTVSQGYGAYGEQIGYAHGAVDAEMAVQLALQWHEKGQDLKPERTFTTSVNGFYSIQPGEKSSADTGLIAVPGGISTRDIEIDYWEEYFADEPFSDDDPPDMTRGRSYIDFSVPASNRMSVESVEVKVNIAGGTAEALDNLRLVLVSPTGTHSELNHFWYGLGTGYYQNAIPGQTLGSPGSGDNGGNLIWSFTTNRSWGELTDDAPILDPLTGEPTVDPDTGEPTGDMKGWRLYVENWSDTRYDMAVSLSWHGQQVAASAQRIQGAVGIDDNGDGDFNYSRVITEQFEIDENPDTLRVGELFTVADPDQERFAGNVTVIAKRASDGFIVDRFVTGADGNYYFDLAPGDYEISVEDPLGRTALVETLTVTNDTFKNGVNFLLDPGTTASPEALISGNVLADINGDGINNGDDVPGPGITIYVDANRNGIHDAGEIAGVTDGDGNYNIVVPNITANTVVDVRAQVPTGWTAVAPVNALSTLLLRQGVSIEDVNFALKPPANGGGGGGGGGVDPTTPATLIGYVFADTNQNQVRDTTELGMAGIRVYIDANNDRVYNDGEATTFTNSQGAYTFSVAAGQHRVRVVAETPYLQTTPTTSFGTRVVNVVAGGTLTGIAFGLYNSANYDYGDLPDSYDLVNGVLNRPKHKKSNYWLGTRWDGELGAHPSANADGDDTAEYDDDDGIQFLDPIVPGATVRLTATANRYNGYLKGWIDWNNNGKFEAEERLIFSGIGSPSNNVLLQEGGNVLTIQVPTGVTASQVYARFRFGEQTTDVTSETPVADAINTPYGVARVGEVEDYRFTVTPPPAPAITGVPSDFDGNGRVDGADFLAWQRGYGKTSQANVGDGDATRDGAVNQFDLQAFKDDFGQVAPEAAAPASTASVQAATSAALVSEEETIVEPSLASFEVFAGDVASTPLALQSDLASQSVRDAAAGRFESRPVWSAIAGRLTDVADRLRQRADKLDEQLDEGRDFVVELLHDVADRVDNFDFESVRRDRAFDDLFGSRRRQGLKIEAEAEAGEETDADDVFAIFADHFEVPRG